MAERTAGSSPHSNARITGVVYLLYFLTAVSTAAIGKGRPFWFQTVTLISEALYFAVTLLFYYLFKPVSRIVSLLAALFGIAGCANDVLKLFNVAPHRFNALPFFACYCLLLGYLILRSTFLPRILGVLMVLAGLGWLIFLSPIAGRLSTYIDVLGFVAELALMLWLVIKGVNEQRWEEQARGEIGAGQMTR
jgi:Domain of unknown function (DUF4386)